MSGRVSEYSKIWFLIKDFLSKSSSLGEILGFGNSLKTEDSSLLGLRCVIS